MTKQPDLSFLFGIFSSSAVVWIFLYSQIVDLTTQEPVNSALLYLAFAHLIAFICLLFSFILLTRQCLKLGLSAREYEQLGRFNSLADYCHSVLFLLWGPMLVFSVTSLLSVNIFWGLERGFLKEFGGFIIGLLLSVLIFGLFFRVNLWRLIRRVKAFHWLLLVLVYPVYVLLLSNYAADVVFSVEKPFYKADEVVRFQVKPKGYILLPQISVVDYNFADTLKEGYETTYEINPKLLRDTATRLSEIEIGFTPQFISFRQRKYFYIPKTKD